MRTCRSPRLLAGFLLGLALPAGAAAIESPQLVSPGDGRREAQVGTACPTFSWTDVEGARGYTLVVYEVGDGGQKPVLSAELPARAASWTPSFETCLQHPGRYGWSVGARTDGNEPTWSKPGVFRLVAPEREPSAAPKRLQDPVSLSGPSSQSFPPSSERALSTAVQPPRSLTSEAFAPSICAGVFSDVNNTNPFCSWIELLAADQIAGQCAAGRFCPENPVTRGQLAMIVERAMRGTDMWRPELGDGGSPNLPPGLPTRTQLGNPSGDAGYYTSMTIGADGLGLVSYWAFTFGDLIVLHCSNVECSEATLVGVDTGTFQSTAIAIGSDGLGLISYYSFNAGDGDLKVVHCSNVQCNPFTVTPIDTVGNVGNFTSITIGADGLGLISYFDGAPNNNLKVAHCANLACTAINPPMTVDSVGDVGWYSSIAIGSDGLGLIAYHDNFNKDLKVAHCGDALCTTGLGSIIPLDTATETGIQPSITIGADGLGLISYFEDVISVFDANQNLMVAHCSDVPCTSATITRLDQLSGDSGRYSSITIGADGLGLISYYNQSSGDLRVAHCSNVNCTEATLSAVDSADNVGQYTSITLGADGLGLISYYDVTNGDFKVAHCPNVLCAPYFRRR